MCVHAAKVNRFVAIGLLSLAIFSGASFGQQPGGEAGSADLATMISAKRFTIEVQSLTPARGGYRVLSPTYTFRVGPDTVSTELPYIGRLYQAPMNTKDNGVNFTSLKFEYTAKPRKKGGWDITLKTHDTPKFPKTMITIQANGNATIMINPTDRETISYSGVIKIAKEAR